MVSGVLRAAAAAAAARLAEITCQMMRPSTISTRIRPISQMRGCRFGCQKGADAESWGSADFNSFCMLETDFGWRGADVFSLVSAVGAPPRPSAFEYRELQSRRRATRRPTAWVDRQSMEKAARSAQPVLPSNERDVPGMDDSAPGEHAHHKSPQRR